MSKTVLITGAGGALGKAVTAKFAKEGFNVIATVSPGKKGELPGMVHVNTVEVDLTDEQAVEKFATYTIAGGTIDVAIFIAGGFAAGDINQTDGAALEKMISLNFKTTFFAARKVFQIMMKQPEGGRIILVGSQQGLHPHLGKGAVGYTLSKSMLFAFAEILNAEGAGKNVVTHVIVPTTIDTPANRKSMPEADFSKWTKPEAIAEVLFFACSEEGKTMKESVLKV